MVVSLPKMFLLAAFGMLLLYIAISPGIAMPAVEWENSYGTPWYDCGYAIRQVSDGGYIVAGTANMPRSNAVYVVKTDADGIKEWDTCLNGSPSVGYDIQPTSDGGYVIAGKTEPESHAFILKLTANGSEAWNHTYGASVATSVLQTDDGGYVLAGETGDSGDGRACIIGTDASGTELWSRDYGNEGYVFATGLHRFNRGGYYFSGSLKNHGLYIAGINGNGSVVWNGSYLGIYVDPPYDFYSGYSVVQTSDGGFIVTGRAVESSDNDAMSERLIKIGANGDVSWQKTYEDQGPCYGRSVAQVPDGGYVAAGFANITDNRVPGFYNDTPRIYCIKVDGNGSLLWEGQFGNGQGLSMVPSGSGDVIIAGITKDTNDGTQVYLLKIKEAGGPSSVISSTSYNPRANILDGPMSDMSLIFENDTPARVIDGKTTAPRAKASSAPPAAQIPEDPRAHLPPQIPSRPFGG